MITRNTPHLFASGAVQRLAEEMTATLLAIREQAIDDACSTGETITRPLQAKGVDFGSIIATGIPQQASCEAEVDTSQVQGVDADLILKPFQWKGSDLSIRAFNRVAAHREIGMQAVELVGEDIDGDSDGVVNELTVGDITALTVYLAAQPRPVTQVELAALGIIELAQTDIDRIQRGEQRFNEIGCGDCHRPQLLLNDPIFSEPSQSTTHRDDQFPAGQDPVALGVDPEAAITFDLTTDQPDNRLTINGEEIRLGAFGRDDEGRAVIHLFGDMKRHDMGPGLAESIDEVETGASVFLTENLWGVGSTAPYLHDGRATTLTEAILEHGGEAEAVRQAFEALQSEDQRALIAFLKNLVLFKVEAEEPSPSN